MRVTIENTTEGKHTRKVTFETPYDDYPLPDLIDEIIIPALLAWGYAKVNVDEVFRREE